MTVRTPCVSLALGVLLWSATAPAQTPDTAPAAAESQQDDTFTDTDAPSSRRLERYPTIPEILVEADRPLTAASSDVIRTRDYALRPHSTTQEILNNVPGLFVVQHQGGGKAVQYLIRGFDGDHGTDFALFTDGIPVNLV